MTPVFTQEVRENGNFAAPVSGAANPIVAIPYSFGGPYNNLNVDVVQVILDGAGIVEGNSATTEVIWAYGQVSVPGPQETLATKTVTVTATDEANGYVNLGFSPNELALPTNFVTNFSSTGPFPDLSGGDYSVSFHSTVTTPNQNLSTTVSNSITQYTTGSNANKWIVLFGDIPLTIGGTAVSLSPNTISSSGGTITVLHGINSTSDFDGSAGSFHRKVELLDSNGNDVYTSGSASSGVSVSLTNISTASATFSSFTVADIFTLKVTIGSGTWNSPNDDFRIVRYEETFTVVP